MKRLVFSLLMITGTLIAAAQVPQAINYQAVARTAQGLLIPDQQVGVRFSILEGNANGTLLYQETAVTTTNNFGLFTLAIGNGTPVTGSFNIINWGNGVSKYLKVEVAPGGGITYTIQGTTQILSVPYALFSEKTRLFAGNAISITNGNTIAANYVAGAGINITGNVIAATGGGSGYWLPDANGIYYQNPLGGVGVGGNTEGASALTVTQKATGGSSAAAVFKGSDTWQTVLRVDNSSVAPAASWALTVAGTGNTAAPVSSFSLYNGTNDRFVWSADVATSSLAVGGTSNRILAPKSKLHVYGGDVNIEQIGSGIILKSPNGQCWRITIDNTGNLVRTAITCP